MAGKTDCYFNVSRGRVIVTHLLVVERLWCPRLKGSGLVWQQWCYDAWVIAEHSNLDLKIVVGNACLRIFDASADPMHRSKLVGLGNVRFCRLAEDEIWLFLSYLVIVRIWVRICVDLSHSALIVGMGGYVDLPRISAYLYFINECFHFHSCTKAGSTFGQRYPVPWFNPLVFKMGLGKPYLPKYRAAQ